MISLVVLSHNESQTTLFANVFVVQPYSRRFFVGLLDVPSLMALLLFSIKHRTASSADVSSL